MVLAAFLFSGCKEKTVETKNNIVFSDNNIDSLSQFAPTDTQNSFHAVTPPPKWEPTRTKIRGFVYKDSAENFYVKIPNKTKSRQFWLLPDSIYMDSIYLLYRGKNVSVKEAIDVESFRNIQNAHHFFIDKNHVYVNSIYPNAWEPMALERKTAKFFKSDSGYVLNDGITLFSYGEFVRAEVDLSKLRVVKYRNHLKGGNYEFLSDGNIVLRYMYRFGEDDFSDYPGLSEKAKSIIRKKYFPKESINNSDSSGVE